MSKQTACLELIEEFLAQKRIAMVGVSRNPQSFNAQLFEAFRRRGYDMVPVKPNVGAIVGVRSFARVQDVRPPVYAALLMTPPEVTERVVRDCAEAGVHQVWMYRGVGRGAVSEKAIEYCTQHGIEVIPGECPYMFFPGTEFIHRAHGFIRKVMRHYPDHARESWIA
jgi:hypothetical protein